MMNRNRREFLADVGKGMLAASVGSNLAAELRLGLPSSFAAQASNRLLFGEREPLVGLMQDTPAAKLLPILVEKLKGGTTLKELVAAGALANARTFGGGHYDGHHAFAALMPSLHMSRELPEARRALPVLKVLHRNAAYIQEYGGKREALHAVAAAEPPKDRPPVDYLRECLRSNNRLAAEGTFAAVTQGSIREAYDDLQFFIEQDIDVHRVVLSWRAWETIDVVGKDQALTLLRQSLNWCYGGPGNKQGIATALPKVLDQYKLLSKPLGDRKAEDA